ncbi:MAG: phosphoribosyltransferase [Myxococcota bacterium]
MQIRPLFSAQEVEDRIAVLAEEVQGDYGSSLPVVVAIAEGALRFSEALCDALARRGPRPEVRVVRARRTDGTQLVSLQIDTSELGDLAGRDVLVLDDIADEGRTLRAMLDLLTDADCTSVRTAVLVSKVERRVEDLELDYVGFEVAGGWVVGFGMDLDGDLRDLDEIGIAEPLHGPP